MQFAVIHVLTVSGKYIVHLAFITWHLLCTLCKFLTEHIEGVDVKRYVSQGAWVAELACMSWTGKGNLQCTLQPLCLQRAFYVLPLPAFNMS